MTRALRTINLYTFACILSYRFVRCYVIVTANRTIISVVLLCVVYYAVWRRSNTALVNVSPNCPSILYRNSADKL